MGFTPVKPFYHASRTKDGGRAKAYRPVLRKSWILRELSEVILSDAGVRLGDGV